MPLKTVDEGDLQDQFQITRGQVEKYQIPL